MDARLRGTEARKSDVLAGPAAPDRVPRAGSPERKGVEHGVPSIQGTANGQLPLWGKCKPELPESGFKTGLLIRVTRTYPKTPF